MDIQKAKCTAKIHGSGKQDLMRKSSTKARVNTPSQSRSSSIDKSHLPKTKYATETRNTRDISPPPNRDRVASYAPNAMAIAKSNRTEWIYCSEKQDLMWTERKYAQTRYENDISFPAHRVNGIASNKPGSMDISTQTEWTIGQASSKPGAMDISTQTEWTIGQASSKPGSMDISTQTEWTIGQASSKPGAIDYLTQMARVDTDSLNTPRAKQNPQTPASMDTSSRVVVIMGGPGTGKSSLGNLLLGTKAFEYNTYNKTKVTSIQREHGNGVTVYDVPSTIRTLHKELKAIIAESERIGVNVVFIYTLKFGTDMTAEPKYQLVNLKKILNEEYLIHLTVVITHGDEFECSYQKEEYEEPTQQHDLQLEFRSRMKSHKLRPDARVTDLLKYCRGRIYFVNNKILGEERVVVRKQILNML